MSTAKLAQACVYCNRKKVCLATFESIDRQLTRTLRSNVASPLARAPVKLVTTWELNACKSLSLIDCGQSH